MSGLSDNVRDVSALGAIDTLNLRRSEIDGGLGSQHCATFESACDKVTGVSAFDNVDTSLALTARE